MSETNCTMNCKMIDFFSFFLFSFFLFGFICSVPSCEGYNLRGPQPNLEKKKCTRDSCILLMDLSDLVCFDFGLTPTLWGGLKFWIYGKGITTDLGFLHKFLFTIITLTLSYIITVKLQLQK